METTHIQKYIHTSPRKLRLVADMVRNLQPSKALDLLTFTPKMAADELQKAIKVALGNAKQSGMEAEKLLFKSLEINESAKMRRFRAGTRGRVKPFKRRMAHIRIVLSDELVVKSEKSKDKKLKGGQGKAESEKGKEKLTP